MQGEPDKEKLAALYERFGFRSLREALLTRARAARQGTLTPALSQGRGETRSPLRLRRGVGAPERPG